MSTGESAPNLTLAWPRVVTTPWLWPAVVVGLLLVLVSGWLFYRDVRRSRSGLDEQWHPVTTGAIPAVLADDVDAIPVLTRRQLREAAAAKSARPRTGQVPQVSQPLDAPDVGTAAIPVGAPASRRALRGTSTQTSPTAAVRSVPEAGPVPVGAPAGAAGGAWTPDPRATPTDRPTPGGAASTPGGPRPLAELLRRPWEPRLPWRSRSDIYRSRADSCRSSSHTWRSRVDAWPSTLRHLWEQRPVLRPVGPVAPCPVPTPVRTAVPPGSPPQAPPVPPGARSGCDGRCGGRCWCGRCERDRLGAERCRRRSRCRLHLLDDASRTRRRRDVARGVGPGPVVQRATRGEAVDSAQRPGGPAATAPSASNVSAPPPATPTTHDTDPHTGRPAWLSPSSSAAAAQEPASAGSRADAWRRAWGLPPIEEDPTRTPVRRRADQRRAGGPMNRHPRRRVALLAVVATMGLAACAAPLPQPEPAPVPAVAPPATTISQSDDVLNDLGEVLAAGDEALDPALLTPRVDGPALAMRTAEYVRAKATANAKPPTLIPTQEQALILPQTDTWPRTQRW